MGFSDEDYRSNAPWKQREPEIIKENITAYFRIIKKLEVERTDDCTVEGCVKLIEEALLPIRKELEEKGFTIDEIDWD